MRELKYNTITSNKTIDNYDKTVKQKLNGDFTHSIF